MEEIVNLLDGSTAKVLLVVFVGFAMYVLSEFRGHIKDTFKKHDDSIKKANQKFGEEVEEMKLSLAQHSSDMDKAQKEIAGQALRLKEDLMNAQIDLNNELNKTKIGMVKINKSLNLLSDNVLKYRGDLESSHGKIISMERYLAKNKNEMGKVLGTLETVKEDYGKVKLIAEKGKRAAEETAAIIEAHKATIKKVEAVFARAEKKKGQNGI